jgi:glycosyltransferase involved in cell wall biosynthesis
MNTITIISICFNNLADLQKTCNSVDQQTVHPNEHLIINGSTSEDIAHWLQSHPQPNYRRWINERDNGIGDAFNKGILNARFPITHLLHAGDTYASKNVLEMIIAYYAQHPMIQWTSGNIRVIRGGIEVVVGKPFDAGKLYRGMRSVAHPTWFVKKEVYERIGLFNNDIKIAMDYDLMCRIAKEPYGYINETIAVFDDSGISTKNYVQSLKDNITIYEHYFGFSLKCRIWQFRLRLLHWLLQTSLGKWLFKIKKGLGLANA